MRYLVTALEMKKYDSETIQRIGIPASVLMERAALESLKEIEKRMPPDHTKSVLVMCGVGNNGGDGLALARLFCDKGYLVDVWCVGNQEKATEEWKRQFAILQHFPVTFCNSPCKNEYTVLIDALFGIGLSREVSGVYERSMEIFQNIRGLKVALDVPSGINSDNGVCMGIAVKVDLTVTFAFCKRGLMLYPGNLYAGEVVTVDIGIGENAFFGEEPEMFLYDEDPAELMPARNKDGNKGTFGKVLLIAGNKKMAGAAILAARAAYRIGAGMVKVISDSENRPIIQQAIPEALFGTKEDLEESLSWADVVAIGPGLGKTKEAQELLAIVLEKESVPLLIDADGLNILAGNNELRNGVREQGAGGRDIVLTPHVGELSRLTEIPISKLKEALWQNCSELAMELQTTVVAKDARTFICRENEKICINTAGNNGMATAGSGDVLAGVIAGLMGQNLNGYKAACIGTYLHAKAGDYVTGKVGEHACMASDIAGALGGQ